MYFLNILCVKIMCEMYGGVGGQDGLEHGITQPLLYAGIIYCLSVFMLFAPCVLRPSFC